MVGPRRTQAKRTSSRKGSDCASSKAANWSAGMKQEGWWWVDVKGKLGPKDKKYSKHYDGSPTEVNENKTYI